MLILNYVIRQIRPSVRVCRTITKALLMSLIYERVLTFLAAEYFGQIKTVCVNYPRVNVINATEFEFFTRNYNLLLSRSVDVMKLKLAVS